MAPNNLNHVVFYTDTPLYGGAERAMLLLAKTLPKDRYKITLVCSNYASLLSWQEMWKDNGFKVLPLKVSHKHDPRHYFQLKNYFSAQ